MLEPGKGGKKKERKKEELKKKGRGRGGKGLGVSPAFSCVECGVKCSAAGVKAQSSVTVKVITKSATEFILQYEYMISHK